MQRTATAVMAMVLFVLLASFRAEPVSAQEEAWDQEQVTELASRMATAVKQLRTMTRKEPHVVSAGTTSKQRITATYLETLKRLDQAASKLARQLEAGETREQTLGTARRIDSLLRDVRQQSAKLHTTEQTDQHLNPALGLAAQLREYYGVAPDPVNEAAADTE